MDGPAQQETEISRKTINAEEAGTEEFTRSKTPPVNRLPTELLSRVLGFAIRATSPICFEHGHWKKELATVSRLWRDVIPSSPHFWNIINVAPEWPLSAVKEHVERSCECLLDVIVNSWYYSTDILGPILDEVVLHVHRWRSLIVWWDSTNSLPLLLQKLGDSTLPCLHYVSICGPGRCVSHTGFLRPENTPSLEQLRLELNPIDSLPGQDAGPAGSIFPSRLLSQKLTTLSLVIRTKYASLQSNSIFLPLLTSLALEVVEPRKLMEAIVAPKLVSFSFARHESDNPFTFKLSAIFGGLDSKFSGVQDLILRKPFVEQQNEDAVALCLAFSNVKNAEMTVTAAEQLFHLSGDSAPIDHWDQLQCLVFNVSDFFEGDLPSTLESLLARLSPEKRSKLRVVFTNFPPDRYDKRNSFDESDYIPFHIPFLYDQLDGICTQEYINVPIATGLELTLRTDSPPRL
ncbi:hypothetical protein V8B97DRAFT_221693 [Scleroderma yunnanense]